MKTKMSLILLAGVLYAAQPVSSGRGIKAENEGSATNSPSSSILPIATIRSSGGLVLNGVPTPPGVHSIIVTHGDVVQTLTAQATATFRDGRVVSLAAGTQYSVPTNARGNMVTIGQRGVSATPMQLLPPLSYKKP